VILLWRNIRYALRASLRSPGFAAVTVISLALGIGANTAIFSILDAILFRELAVPQPRELVQLSPIYRNGGRVPFSFPMYQALDRGQRVFSGLYGWTGAASSNVEAGGTLFLGGVRAVTGNYYSGLGATPLVGRLIAPGDDAGGTSHVAVLGYECWENRFGRDSAVIGKTLRIEGKPFTIVGVTRPWFAGMTPGESPDITIPITASPFDRQSRALLWIFATGRLRTGVSIVQARTQLASFWPELLLATAPTQSRGPRRQSFLAMRLAVEPAAAGANAGLRDRASRPLYLLMGVVALILLIACVNLANLTLARAAARSQEISTRAALGASRRQIVMLLLAESLLLSAAGALLALAFSYWGSPLLLGLITRRTLAPVVLDLRPDWRVFSFTAAVAVLTGTLIGLVPAWQMSGQEPALVLRQRGGSRRQALSGKVLIVTQIALSLVLLFGAGLLLRTFENLRWSDPGFQKTGILEAALQPRPDGYKGLDMNAYLRQLVERAAGLPGAASAAFSDLAVPAGGGWKETVSPAGADGNAGPSVLANLAAVSPGFFKTLAIPLVSGRDFEWSDGQRHSPIAMVDSETARRLFPSGGAIGQRVRFGVQPEFQDLEIVGVARAARLIDLRDPSQRVFYIPFAQHPEYGKWGNLFLRAKHAATLERALDNEIRSFGREYVTETKTIEQMSDGTLAAERATAIFSTAFAAAALLLAGIGLFGLMSYTVTRRTREIGVRMALGSQPGAVLRMILRETLLLTLTGIALGAPCALAATRFIAHSLFGLSPVDPLTFAAASGALFAVGAIAGYLPARRALNSDPMAALRCD